MGDSAQLFEQVKAFLGKDGLAMNREMAARQFADFLTSQGFTRFERAYPSQATYLRELVSKNDWLSTAAIQGVAFLLNKTVMKNASGPLKSGTIDVLVNLVSLLKANGDPRKVESSNVLLGKKILAMSPDAMIAFADWRKGFSAEQQQAVYSVLADKSPEEIEALVMLPVENRETMIGLLASFIEPENDKTSRETESPLLGMLRSYNRQLKQKLDNAIPVDAVVVDKQ